MCESIPLSSYPPHCWWSNLRELLSKLPSRRIARFAAVGRVPPPACESAIVTYGVCLPLCRCACTRVYGCMVVHVVVETHCVCFCVRSGAKTSPCTKHFLKYSMSLLCRHDVSGQRIGRACHAGVDDALSAPVRRSRAQHLGREEPAWHDLHDVLAADCRAGE